MQACVLFDIGDHSYLIGVFHLREKTGVPKERNSRRIKTRLELQKSRELCAAGVRALVQTPGGFARGGTVFRGLQPSEAKRGSAERSEAPPSEARPSHRAKRGSTERSEAPPSELKRGSSEAPPSEARPREGHREVAITLTKTQKGSTRKPTAEPHIVSHVLF